MDPSPPQHHFGPFKINDSEVFAKTPLSLAFVNLKPVVPGHVLITPRRVVARLGDLDPTELADMWVSGPTLHKKRIRAPSLALVRNLVPLAAGSRAAHRPEARGAFFLQFTHVCSPGRAPGTRQCAALQRFASTHSLSHFAGGSDGTARAHPPSAPKERRFREQR